MAAVPSGEAGNIDRQDGGQDVFASKDWAEVEELQLQLERLCKKVEKAQAAQKKTFQDVAETRELLMQEADVCNDLYMELAKHEGARTGMEERISDLRSSVAREKHASAADLVAVSLLEHKEQEQRQRCMSLQVQQMEFKTKQRLKEHRVTKQDQHERKARLPLNRLQDEVIAESLNLRKVLAACATENDRLVKVHVQMHQVEEGALVAAAEAQAAAERLEDAAAGDIEEEMRKKEFLSTETVMQLQLSIRRREQAHREGLAGQFEEQHQQELRLISSVLHNLGQRYRRQSEPD